MRYERQTILPEIGKEGQVKLSKSKVLIVGVGGLGSPVALYLAGAGVGSIGLIDHDSVSLSNLQRQVLYSEREIVHNKAICAKRHLKQLNSSISVSAYPFAFSNINARELVSRYDIVVDGTDNYETRYLINDVCMEQRKPYVYGAISEFEGQVSVFNANEGYNYRMLFPDEEAMKNIPKITKGTVGMTPAIIGSVQASEVLKLICGFGDVLSGKLWTIDLRTMVSEIIQL